MKISSRILPFTMKDTGKQVPGYRLFERADGKRLIFWPVPKNANSSFKALLADYLNILEKYDFLDDDAPMVDLDESMRSPGKRWLWNFLPSKRRFVEISRDFVDYRLAVVRDPYSRFFSAYKNRVVWHKDAAFRGLSVERVIAELENGNFENKHFLPQTFFLGKDPGYYTHLALAPNFKPVLDGLEDFFGYAKDLPKLQTRHGEAGDGAEQSDEIKARLKNIYKSDFNFISKATFIE